MINIKRKARQVFWFYLFMLPALIGFGILSVYPFVRALYISFTDRTLLAFEETQWIGLKNYIRAFNDPYVWESLSVSLIFALFSVLITAGLEQLPFMAILSPSLQYTGYEELYLSPNAVLVCSNEISREVEWLPLIMLSL